MARGPVDVPGPLAHHARVADRRDRSAPRRIACGRMRLARVLMAAGIVLGTTPAPVEASSGMGEHLRDSPRLLGDVHGERTRLERLGLHFRLFYNQLLSGKPSGGGANDGAAFGHSGSYDFFAGADLEALTGWRGADVLLHVKGQYDRNLNPDVGALSDPIDDADFDAGIYVDELWLQQAWLDDRVRVRIGFAEQQTVFDRNAHANSEDRQFLTTFLDNNGVVPLPNGLAVTLIVDPVPWAELAVGCADADNRPRNDGFDTFFDDADSLTGYFELAFESPFEGRDLSGRYRVGVFIDGRQRLDFRTRLPDRGHVGAYLSFDQLVLREGTRWDEGLGVFARAGYADPDVNRVAWFWSAGLEYAGPIPRRGGDVLGFGVYQAIGSSVYRDAVDPRFERETGIELYYAARVLGWLVVTPDLQVIVDPGATGQAGDVFLATLRLRTTF